ncbi:MAG: hypothetical protein K2K82_04790 [Muribaculaceae bacterium]|nr:hypothetical protein [Muribaculaceae bacterium]
MRSLLYIVIFMVVCCCSCSRPLHPALDQAERLMLTDPSAAMATLNDVDVAGLSDSAEMARWALLYSEAMVANHLSAPTDTIVDIAIDYYGFHGMTDEFQKASRLKALIMSESETNELASALYLQKEKEYFLYKEKVRRQIFMYVSLISILIALGVILWSRQRMKYHRLQNEALMADASNLRSQIESEKSDISRLETTLHNLLDGRFALIDSLCQTYYETQGTPLERKAIVDKVKKEIESVRLESMPQFEKVVNDCRDNMLVRVKGCFPEIKPVDYQLLVYQACGFSARTISLLLGENIDVIYKRKSRLKSRLREHVAPDFPQIMDIF